MYKDFKDLQTVKKYEKFYQRLGDGREAKLMQQPLCEVCLSKGIVTPAEVFLHLHS